MVTGRLRSVFIFLFSKCIANSFIHFTHLVQISDWLSLQQNMLKNYYVDVCDVDAIAEAISKQKVIHNNIMHNILCHKITIINDKIIESIFFLLLSNRLRFGNWMERNLNLTNWCL